MAFKNVNPRAGRPVTTTRSLAGGPLVGAVVAADGLHQRLAPGAPVQLLLEADAPDLVGQRHEQALDRPADKGRGAAVEMQQAGDVVVDVDDLELGVAEDERILDRAEALGELLLDRAEIVREGDGADGALERAARQQHEREEIEREQAADRRRLAPRATPPAAA